MGRLVGQLNVPQLLAICHYQSGNSRCQRAAPGRRPHYIFYIAVGIISRSRDRSAGHLPRHLRLSVGRHRNSTASRQPELGQIYCLQRRLAVGGPIPVPALAHRSLPKQQARHHELTTHGLKWLGGGLHRTNRHKAPRLLERLR